MTESGLSRPAPAATAYQDRPRPDNLADILERVLDKGIIIAGDIRVNLLDIELLTVKIRLLVVSVDKAEEVKATVDAAARSAFHGGQSVAVLLRQKLIGIKTFGKK